MPTDIELMKEGKVVTFDIETTDLKAKDGYILCSCIKEVNPDNLKGKIHTVSITDPENISHFDDKYVVKKTIDILNQYDLVIDWYGSRFDFPFLNTRSLHHGIAPPVKNFRRDLCLCARGFGCMRSNRLYVWEEYLFGKSLKTHLPWNHWIRAIRGDMDAINDIVDHCKRDVTSTEKIYKRFMPLLGRLRKR